VTAVRPVAEYVAELEAQYLAARRELEAKVRL
jgi:nitronate monooxygenase